MQDRGCPHCTAASKTKAEDFQPPFRITSVPCGDLERNNQRVASKKWHVLFGFCFEVGSARNWICVEALQ